MRDDSARWGVLFAFLVLMTLGAGAIYVVVVGLKPIAADLGWPRSVPSAAYALAMLGMGVGGIVMGSWSDRVGIGPPVLVGVLAIVLGCFLAGRAESAAVFLAVNGLLIGVFGNGALFAPVVADVARRFHYRRGLAIGIVSAGPSLAGAVFPPVHRFLIDAWGWREAYFGYAAAVLAAGLPLALAAGRGAGRPGRADGGGEGAGGKAAAGGRRALGMHANTLQLLLCLAIVGCCIAMSMPVVQLVAYATDLGHPPARAAEALSLLLAASIVARVAWGALSDRVGGLAALFLGSSGQCAMLAFFLFVESLPGLYAIAVLYGLAYGGITSMYSVVIRQYMPLAQVGWRIGLVYLFGTLGMSLGGLTGGVVFDATGSYDLAFLVGIAFNGANLAIVVPLLRRERRPPRGTPAAALPA